VFTRLFFSLTWFVFALWVEHVYAVLVFVLVSIGLLYARHRCRKPILRSGRLLLWFFVPMLLLHGLFTPGTYIKGLPLSVEGVQRALMLGLHVTSMFFTAMLVASLWRHQDFVPLLRKSVWLRTWLMPYLLLFPRLREVIPDVLKHQWTQWRALKNPWQALPDTLADSVCLVLQQTRGKAAQVWQAWDKLSLRMMNHTAEAVSGIVDIGLMLLAGLAWMGIWLL